MEDKFLKYIQSRPKSAKSGPNYVSGINCISKKFLEQNLFSITSPENVKKIILDLENNTEFMAENAKGHSMYLRAIKHYKNFLLENIHSNNNEISNLSMMQALEMPYYEGNIVERTILQKNRNREIVRNVKKRDNYTCCGCGFYFDNKIVEVHHLIPLSNMDGEKQIKKEDLITFCPNCHAIAHFLLNEDEKYKNRKILIDKLQEIYKLNIDTKVPKEIAARE